MTAEVTRVVEGRWSVQYVGTNGADVLAAVPGSSLVADGGGVLVFEVNSAQYELTSGDWFVWRGANNGIDPFGTFGDTLHGQIYDPRPRLVTRQGYGDIAAGGPLGGAQDVTVTLSAPMAGVDYVPHVQLLGAPGLVGGHGLAAGAPWTVVDEDTVTVHLVSEIAAAAITGGVYVTATELV